MANLAGLIRICERNGACLNALEWLRNLPPQTSLKRVWEQCNRGDWMLWLADRLDIDRKLTVLAACDCARPALKYVPENEKRPEQAITTAERWCAGKATLDEVRSAFTAAAAAATFASAGAYAGTYAYVAAARAAGAARAAAVVYDAADPYAHTANAAAAAYFAAAANAAANDAPATSAAAAKAKSWKRSAAFVRKRIPYRTMLAAFKSQEVAA